MIHTDLWNEARKLNLGKDFLDNLDTLLTKLESESKQLIIGGVMHPLPDLKSKSLPLFLEEYKNLASKDVLTKVWEYGNNQWENGYSQGKYNPDFD